jgi:hypothetical protein
MGVSLGILQQPEQEAQWAPCDYTTTADPNGCE